MVPIYTGTAARSPYTAPATTEPTAVLERAGTAVGPISFPRQPQFYSLTTADGIPYWQIALLHGQDVLATTVLQTCMRYRDPATACQFCAIEKSLEAGRHAQTQVQVPAIDAACFPMPARVPVHAIGAGEASHALQRHPVAKPPARTMHSNHAAYKPSRASRTRPRAL